MALPIIGGWLPIVLAALSMSFMVIGLARMIGKAFNLPYLEMWAKVETQEFAVTLLILVSLTTVIGIGDTIVQASTGTGCPIGDCLLDNAISDVNARVANSDTAFSQLASMYKTLGKWTNFYKSYMTAFIAIPLPLPLGWIFEPPGIIFTHGEAPGQGMGIFFGLISSATNTIMMTVAENIAFAQFLQFVKLVSFPILLPLGVLLRAFSVSRRVGSTLIAISFGLTMILPASVIIGQNELYDSSKAAVSIGSIPSPNLPPAYFCNFFFTLLWNSLGISGFAAVAAGTWTYIAPDCTAELAQCSACLTAATTACVATGGIGCPAGVAICTVCGYPIPKPITVTSPIGLALGGEILFFPIITWPHCDPASCWAWCSFNFGVWYAIVNTVFGLITTAIMKNYMTLSDVPVSQATSALFSSDAMFYNALMSTILIILSALVTASFIRGISETIGGDSRLYGLYRLV